MGFLGKNNSEAKAQIASLRETLVDDKKRVADELAYFQSVSRDIKKAKKRVKAAEAAFDKRENDKNASKLEAANDELTASIGAFHDSEEQIKQLLDVVSSFVMLDDSGLLCDAYNTTEWGTTDCTRMTIMPKERFPKWLEERKNVIKNISDF